MDDHELLRAYAERRSQDAFRTLVDRHLPMVYSAACRMVRDVQLAEEVAQGVFAKLAEKAGEVTPPQVVGGWLYNTTRHLAMHAVRAEQRRREREQAAALMQSLCSSSDADRIADQLEPAMDQLDADERDVLVLRFLQNRSLRDVGAELGISEDAARMRVNRAVDQLRSILDHQGVRLTPALLASALAASTVSAAPPGLTAAIMAATFGESLATVTTTTALLTTMNWINTKTITAVVAAALLAGTGTYVVKQQEVAGLEAERRDILAQQEQLRADQAKALAAAQIDRDELERLRKEAAEILRLRREVSQLRDRLSAPTAAAQPTAPAPGAPTAPKPPAAIYFGRDQLAHVGYATPEAALATIGWAAVTGDPEQAKEGLADGLLANPQAYQAFETSRQQVARVFNGMEIQAKKIISDTEVEMKVRTDLRPGTDGATPMPAHVIVSLVKVGDQWKMSQSRRYRETWDQSGHIEAPVLVGR